MTCHVCSRQPNSRLTFFCPTCARNQLYPIRLDHARTLLEKESTGQEIDGALKKQSGGHDAENAGGKEHTQAQQNGPTRLSLQQMRTRKSHSSIRTQSMQVRIATLRREIEVRKEEIARRRTELAKRRSDAESANYQLPDRRAAAVTKIQDDAQRVEKNWNTLHNKTAESRIFLCRAVANLYSLRQKSRRRHGELISTYLVGGINIIDPRDMNSASPAHITTSLSHISHLLVLVSHYLSLRLPAEITLPHRGYPLPTIFPPASSYTGREAPFPGLSPSNSSFTSPTASKTSDARPYPRPRPLFLDRNLPKLAKEDPAGYALFVEGVALLAWDVSWVCRSQGLNVGIDSWEDVCEIGRNLWQLLVAPPALTKALAGRDFQTKVNGGKQSPRDAIHRSLSFPILGHYSHGGAHSFLGNSEGLEFMKMWKLPSPVKVADKLKYTLLGEMATAEWELLEEDEWDDEGALQAQNGGTTGEHETQVAGDTKKGREDGSTDDDTKSTMTGRTEYENGIDGSAPKEEQAEANGRPKGTRGWTKIKSR